jgi:predicted HNH restriction endonuclease
MTPKTHIVRQLRLLWLKSKERSQALKNSQYTCEHCGVKQSTAKGREQKVEVHHKKGVTNWDRIIEVIREELLCDPEDLEVLCPDCHDEEDGKNRAYSFR